MIYQIPLLLLLHSKLTIKFKFLSKVPLFAILYLAWARIFRYIMQTSYSIWIICINLEVSSPSLVRKCESKFVVVVGLVTGVACRIFTTANIYWPLIKNQRRYLCLMLNHQQSMNVDNHQTKKYCELISTVCFSV